MELLIIIPCLFALGAMTFGGVWTVITSLFGR